MTSMGAPTSSKEASLLRDLLQLVLDLLEPTGSLGATSTATGGMLWRRGRGAARGAGGGGVAAVGGCVDSAAAAGGCAGVAVAVAAGMWRRVRREAVGAGGGGAASAGGCAGVAAAAGILRRGRREAEGAVGGGAASVTAGGCRDAAVAAWRRCASCTPEIWRRIDGIVWEGFCSSRWG